MITLADDPALPRQLLARDAAPICAALFEQIEQRAAAARKTLAAAGLVSPVGDIAITGEDALSQWQAIERWCAPRVETSVESNHQEVIRIRPRMEAFLYDLAFLLGEAVRRAEPDLAWDFTGRQATKVQHISPFPALMRGEEIVWAPALLVIDMAYTIRAGGQTDFIRAGLEYALAVISDIR